MLIQLAYIFLICIEQVGLYSNFYLFKSILKKRFRKNSVKLYLFHYSSKAHPDVHSVKFGTELLFNTLAMGILASV